MEKYYKAGELCRLFDIGIDSIRYYEKVGILTPKRHPHNNYRLYTIEDVRKLTMIRELMKLNFSLEQIKQFDDNRNVENTIHLLEQELHIVNESIVNLYETKNSIQARLSSFRQNLSDQDFGSFKVVNLFERPCIMISNSDLPDQYIDYYLTKYMHTRQRNIDTIGACDCYTLDISQIPYRTKSVFFYSDTITYQSNHVLPEGKYLSVRYRGSHSKTQHFVPLMLDYAKKHRLTLIGDPIEFCHIDDYETAIEDEYITELQIRVK
jgi:DNA-binding transcriptional MerR regulator/effector-binding domain-containing protein